MQSLEKYIVKLVFEFFSLNIQEENHSKLLLNYISQKSDIYFEGLTIICKKEESGFFVSINCKCLSIKMKYISSNN